MGPYRTILFEAWNEDQTLESAMTSSVNWYFQSLDNQLGKAALQSYVQSIEYGNENINGELASYWMESTPENFSGGTGRTSDRTVPK